MAQKFLTDIELEAGLVDGSNGLGSNGQVLSSTGSGVSWIDLETVTTAEKIEVTVKNIHGSTLAKGTVVHAAPSATPPSGNVIEVIAADANVAANMPAIGILNEAILNEGEGQAVMFGAVSGIDTSSFNIGDELYVSTTAGALTNTKPTDTTELIQKIAIVIKSHASNGLIKVFGAGRSNDVPNLVDRTITFSANQKFTDNSLILLGGGDMFQIGHKATYSQIATYEGHLYIDNNATDQDIIFRSDDGSGGLATYFKLDGSLVNGTTTLGAVNFPDKSKIFMGAGSDLRIYHDGSDSYIEQATASDLIITNTGAAEVEIKSNRKVNIYIDQNNDDTNNSFNILSNVNTYAANDVIFEVTQTGNVNIDGNVNAGGSGTFDTLTLTSGNDNLTFTQSSDDWEIKNAQQDNALKIYDGTGGVELKYAGSAYFMADSNGVHTASNVDFYVDTNLIYADTTNDRVGIGKTPGSYKLDVNGQIASNTYIIAGLGNGGVALTHNDGYGNANLTFNHVSGTPEQDGSSGRIVVTTDSTTAKMAFELKDNVTQGTAVDTPMIMELYSNEIRANENLRVRDNDGGIINLDRNDTSIVDGNPLGRLRFSGDDPTDGTFNRGAEIRGEAAGTWSANNYPAELQFYTTATNTDLLALKLDSSQNATFSGDVTLSDGSLNITQSTGTETFQVTTVYDRVGKFVSSDANAFLAIQDSNSTDNGVGINVAGDQLKLLTGNSAGLTVESDQEIRFNAYGSGTFTGTSAYNLAVDSSGNVIETSGNIVDGSGTANYLTMWTDSDTIGNGPASYSSVNALTTFSSDLKITKSGIPKLYLYDNGNGGGGGAEAQIIFQNTSGNAIGIGYTNDNTSSSDLIISTDAGSTYGGYLGLDAGAILDATADIILDPKSKVLVTKDLTIDGGDLTITKQNDAPTMTLLHDGTNPSTNDLLFKMQFQSDYDGSHQNWGKIELSTNASSVRTEMDFYVKSTSGNEELGLRIEGGTTKPKTYIYGDLIVEGDTTTLNTQTVEVEDNILQLNTTQGSPDTATATTSGISIYRGDGITQASFIFDDADDTWDLTDNLALAANKYILIGTDSGDPFNSGSAIRIQDDGHGYVQMKVGASSQGGILIGDTTDDYVGGFVYNNGSDELIFKQNNVDCLTISGSQHALFAGNVEATRYIATNGNMFQLHVASWNSGQTDHYVLYNGWTANTGDYVFLKSSGNQNGNNGAILISDGNSGGRVYFGLHGNQQAAVDSATAPLATTYAYIGGNGNLFEADTRINGTVGINMAPPSAYQFATSYTQTDPNADFRFAHFIDANFSGADNTTADREQGGIFIDIDSTADGDDTDEHRLYGIYIDQRFSGFSDSVTGVYSRVESNNNTEKTANIQAVHGIAIHDSGVSGGVSSIYGGKFETYVEDDGDMDNSYGAFGRTLVNSTRAVNVDTTHGGFFEIQIDSPEAISYGAMYGVRAIIDNNEGSVPTFGNQYLYHGEYQGTKGSNAYGLYLVNEDKNYISGNVGIKATNPDDGDLQIGDANSTFNIAVAGTRAKFGYAGDNAIVQGGSSKGVVFCVNNNTFNSGEAMRITSDGSVGINTAAPDADAALHVSGPNTSPDLNATTPQDYTAVFSNSDTAYGTLFAVRGNGDGLIQQRRLNTTTYYNLNLQPFGDNSARLGIGTVSPASKLHLVYPDGSYGAASTSGFINEASSGRATMRLRSATDNPAELFFDVNGAIRWDISCRNGTSPNLQFYPQAATPSLTGVAAHTFELQQDGDVVVTGSGSSGYFRAVNADFSGNVTVGNDGNISMDSSANGQLMLDGSGYQGAIALDGSAMYVYHNSSSRNLVLGTNETARLTISGSNGAATFHSSTVTIEGTNAYLYVHGSGESGWNIYAPNDAFAHMDVRTADTDSAIPHKYIRNSANDGYKPYYENWYSGSAYVSFGAVGTNWRFFNPISMQDGNTISLFHSDGSGSAGAIHMPRAGAITFYGDYSLRHSIQSRSNSGGTADDIRINSYGAVYINLDSNNNNTSVADFMIGRHGDSTGTITDLFRVDGETAVVTVKSTNGSNDAFLNSNGTQYEIDVNRHPETGTFSDTTKSHARIQLDGAAGGSYIKFYTAASNNSTASERVRINPDGDIQIARYLEHYGDTNSYLGWSGADDFRIYVGGIQMLRYDEGITGTDYTQMMSDEFRLYANGDFHADGDVVAYSTTVSSDKRLKKDIKPIDNALDIVDKLQGVHFNWKEDGKKSIGYIAQDVEKILPEMVTEKNHFDKGEFKTVNYAAMVSIMGEAIKELKAEVEQLKKQINGSS